MINSLINIIKKHRPLLETVFNETGKRLKISKPKFTKKEAQKLIKKIKDIPEKKIIFIRNVVQNIIKPPMKGGAPVQPGGENNRCIYNTIDGSGDYQCPITLAKLDDTNMVDSEGWCFTRSDLCQSFNLNIPRTLLHPLTRREFTRAELRQFCPEYLIARRIQDEQDQRRREMHTSFVILMGMLLILFWWGSAWIEYRRQREAEDRIRSIILTMIMILGTFGFMLAAAAGPHGGRKRKRTRKKRGGRRKRRRRTRRKKRRKSR